MPHPPQGRAPGTAGQASVELVAMLPMALLLLAVVWQLVLVGHAAWSAHAAARAAARAHAVGRDPLKAARASLPGDLDDRVTLEAGTDDDPQAVRLRVRIPSLIPGLPSPSVSAGSTFASQS